MAIVTVILPAGSRGRPASTASRGTAACGASVIPVGGGTLPIREIIVRIAAGRSVATVVVPGRTAAVTTVIVPVVAVIIPAAVAAIIVSGIAVIVPGRAAAAAVRTATGGPAVIIVIVVSHSYFLLTPVWKRGSHRASCFIA
jgi:hypothetical protein